MKKIIFSIFSTLCCALIMFSGCSADIYSLCQKNISDERQNYFQGESENYFVSFSSGMRESPYELDGKSQDLVEFGVVTIKPKANLGEQKLTYVVSIDGNEYSGEFEHSPFDDTYAGDISKRVDGGSKVFVTISDGSKEDVANLECVSNDFKISSKQALTLAADKAKEQVFEMKGNFEIYIKIVADLTQKMEQKFWLVMFLPNKGNSISVLINPDSGEVEIKNF